jgi:hypothetical protein
MKVSPSNNTRSPSRNSNGAASSAARASRPPTGARTNKTQSNLSNGEHGIAFIMAMAGFDGI